MRTIFKYLFSVLLLSAAAGCAAATHPATNNAVIKPHAPSDFTPIEASLDWLIVLGVIGVGVGAAIYFFLPTPEHGLGVAIGGAAASVEASALLLKLVIPYLLYIVGGLGILALLVGLYELYAYRATIEADLAPIDAGPAPAQTAAKTPPAIKN